MKCIFVIEETLTLFGSLGKDIDTVASLAAHWQLGNSLRGLVLFPKEKEKKRERERAFQDGKMELEVEMQMEAEILREVKYKMEAEMQHHH